MKTKHTFSISSKCRSFTTACAVAAALLPGVLVSSAQTNDFLYSGSEQTITLNPGRYDITVYGAQGGNANAVGGLGAEMEGQFNFTTATTLTILVGGAGGGAYNTEGAGGGGGSFVFDGTTPLVVAGGGGGGGGEGIVVNTGSPGDNGVTGTSGDNFYGAASGGSDGSGGSGGGGGGVNGSAGGGGGGGGYNGSGSNGGSGDQYVSNGGYGGSSYLSGGSGGHGNEGGGGGYGCGGGGGYGGGGGGGGYSGGGGGYGGYNYTGSWGGGGGGSYIDSSALANLAEISGVSSPDDSPNGEIIITQVPPPIIIASAAVTQGQFGFDISGPTNSTIVVEECTNLVNPIWIPVVTNTLSGGTNYFSDPSWTSCPIRYYRVSSP